MHIRRECPMSGTAPIAVRKRSGKHRNSKSPWRPTPEMCKRLEAFRVAQGVIEGDPDYALTRAINDVVETGLDREESKDRVSRRQADGLEAKLEIASLQLA